MDTDQREAYAGIATGAACDAGIGDRDLGRVCARLLVDLVEEQPREEAHQVAQELRCVSRRRVGQGLVRFTVDAPDTDAALIDGVLNGPLAAPEPGEDGQGDPRSAGQRRYDAVLMVLGRGLANPGPRPRPGGPR